MFHRAASVFIFGIAIMLASSSIVVAAQPWGQWTSTKSRDHPLAGKLWFAKAGAFVSPEDYANALRAADIVLLGENHDNPDHHRLQAWAIGQIAQSGRKGAVVFEMIGADEAGAIARIAPGENAAEAAAKLGPAVKWEERGWPSWSLYAPIAEAALKAGYTLNAGDASQAALREVAKEGLTVLAADERQRLRLDRDLDAPLNDALLDELFDGHCQMLDRARLGPMANVQRLRDATLAASLERARPAGGIAILIAGNGHVRTDRGVPLYLGQPGGPSIVSVMHIEVDGSEADPARFAPKSPDGTPAADFIWFTPGTDRGDPCEVFRAMKKK